MVVIMLQMCNRRNTVHRDTIVKKDTVFIKKDSTIYSNPTIIVREGTDSIIKEYLPDTNYNKLLTQYNSLLKLYFTKTIQEDNLKIDSIGWVNIIDTVNENLIVGRKFTYNLTYPKIIETKIVPEETKRQVYIGVGMSGNKNEVFAKTSAGFLYKNKKDNIIGISGTLNSNNQLGVMVQGFWKIKL